MSDKLDEIAKKLWTAGAIIWGWKYRTIPTEKGDAMLDAIRAALDEAGQEDRAVIAAVHEAIGEDPASEDENLGEVVAIIIRDYRAEIEHCHQLLRDAEVLYQEELTENKQQRVEVERLRAECERLKLLSACPMCGRETCEGTHEKGTAARMQILLDRVEAAEAIALGGKLCISEQHKALEAKLAEAQAGTCPWCDHTPSELQDALAAERAKVANLQATLTLYEGQHVTMTLERAAELDEAEAKTAAMEAERDVTVAQREQLAREVEAAEARTAKLVEALEEHGVPWESRVLNALAIVDEAAAKASEVKP